MKKLTGISKLNFFLALLVLCMFAGHACAAALEDHDNTAISVGNDNGTYLVTGTAYQLNLEADTADLHIASDPANSAGDITQANSTSGTFYITCTNDSRVFDDTVLMLAVNGTIPDNFTVAITSSGYRWEGPAENSTLPGTANLTYVSSALSETFAKADLSYGPQIWKPANSADSPIYTGQNMSDAEDTFSLVFIDLNAGALCNAENLTSIDDLTDRGAVKIEYVFENLQSFAVFNAYGLTNTTSAEIVTANDVSGSLYSVLIEEEEAEPVMDNITVSPSTASVEINATANFTATAFDTEGSVMSGITFNWSVSDEAIGNVTSEGEFTAFSAGTVNVTASCGNESGYAVVTVSEAVVPTPTPTPAPKADPGTYGGVIPGVNNVYLKVANDYGARFDDFGNDTFHVEWTGGGLNAVHIAQGGSGFGELTSTNSMTGTFYVTETGGRGYHDEIFLCVAVNGTIPDDFRIHITADGYQWTPNATPHTEPVVQEIEYVNPTVDEWFDKDDFIYGPQIWRPAAGTQYPIFSYSYSEPENIVVGQDMTDTSNTFMMMFVDLNGGILSGRPLKVRYEIENLNTMVAFDVYAYTKADTVGSSYAYNVTSWTNALLLDGNGPNGWTVSGAPLPDAATVVIAPVSASVPVNGKQQFTATAYDSNGDEISGAPITWTSSVTGVGTVDSDGLFTPVSEGSTVVTATAASGVSQTASVTVTAAVEKVLTTITLDPDTVIMYTDQIGNRTFTATGYDQFGDEFSAVYTWSSTVPVVGSIDQKGFFTGKNEGSTVVSATNGSVSQTATVEIKQHSDWDVTLTGAIERTLNRSTIIDLSSGGMVSYTDNRDIYWEGVNLTTIIGLFDDHDPSTFNTTLAGFDYNVTIKGEASGHEKTVLITTFELLDNDETFIIGYKMDGYEIPEYAVDGRTYWPLKLTGSAIANYGRNLEEISNITLELPKNVGRIEINSDSVKTNAEGKAIQFAATAYDFSDIAIDTVPFTWSVSDTSLGTIDSDGLFTPLKAGYVNVTASYYSVSESIEIEVMDNPPSAKTWYVDQDGNGDFTSIQAAIDYGARNGDTIIVRDGIYQDKILIDKGIYLKSENGPNKTFIQHEASRAFGDLVQINADNVKISGFNFSYYGRGVFGGNVLIRVGSYASGVSYPVNNTEIFGNVFFNTSYAIAGAVNTARIENNFFTSSENYESDKPFHIINPFNVTIKNNWIEKNKNGITLSSGGGNVIENNTLLLGGSGYAIELNNNNYSDFKNLPTIVAYNNISGYSRSVYIYKYSNVEVYSNQCNSGEYSFYLRNSENVTALKNSFGESSDYGAYLYANSNIIISDNSFGKSGGYTLTFRTSCVNTTITNNEFGNGETATIYLYSLTSEEAIDGFSFYMNNFSDCTDGSNGFIRPRSSSVLPNLNSSSPITYVYNGETFSGFIGNQYNTYSGIDTSGDFLGNTPFVEDGVYDYHPLTGTYSDYTILGEGKIPGDSQNATLDFNGLGVQENAGKQTATINTTQTQTTQNGNTLTISRANYDVEIELDSDMATNGDEVTGTIKSVTLTTSEISKSGGDAGNISASIVANLNGIPNGASITTTLNNGASAAQRSAFQLAATDDGLRVGEVACTLSVIKQNLVNGDDVASATIRMSIDKAWVDAHGGNDAMKIIRWSDDGAKEILNTVLIGTNGDMLIFEAVSPNGFSIFGLAATSVAPESPVTSSAPASGGKSTVSTESVQNIGAGETISLVFDESAITKIDVKAAAEIPELMLTVEEVSKPLGVEDAPDEVYQYVEITAYHAPEESIAMATLHFNIVKDWLDSLSSTPSDVSVYHYDEVAEEWVLLSTVSDGSDIYAYNFFADTPGFSLFAITAKENTASTVDVSNPAADSASEPGMQSSETGSTAGSEEGIPVPYILLATGLIICIPAAGYGWIRRKEK